MALPHKEEVLLLSVFADVEQLEILIGGKRAGNNSPEMINEAADICKRLFTGGIMDISDLVIGLNM